MSTETKTRTYLAVRPGMQTVVGKQFPGMEVVVDETLVGSDFEFRKRELSGIELIEAQLEQEEKVAADPKSATTVLVPVVGLDQNEREFWDNEGHDSDGPAFLVIRCASSTPSGRVIQIVGDIRGVKSTRSWDGVETINKGATAANIRAALKDDGIEVYSISEVNDIAPLKL